MTAYDILMEELNATNMVAETALKSIDEWVIN